MSKPPNTTDLNQKISDWEILNLSKTALRLLLRIRILIARDDPYLKPTAALAAELNTSERHIRRALDELVQHQLAHFTIDKKKRLITAVLVKTRKVADAQCPEVKKVADTEGPEVRKVADTGCPEVTVPDIRGPELPDTGCPDTFINQSNLKKSSKSGGGVSQRDDDKNRVASFSNFLDSKSQEQEPSPKRLSGQNVSQPQIRFPNWWPENLKAFVLKFAEYRQANFPDTKQPDFYPQRCVDKFSKDPHGLCEHLRDAMRRRNRGISPDLAPSETPDMERARKRAEERIEETKRREQAKRQGADGTAAKWREEKAKYQNLK